MHQEINRTNINKVDACVFRPVKRSMRTLCKQVYQFALMEENVHRGAHALTGFMFAPSVIIKSTKSH